VAAPIGVRVTHWIHAAGITALAVSGVAILLAHPRLYWGETGTLGMPSLVDLPLPFVFGHSGWGRSLHFLSAWVVLCAGASYLAIAVRTRHFRQGFRAYPPRRRVTYLAIVLVAAPLLFWTGFAMSPAVTSVVPSVVTVLGGQQSARTIHFAVAGLVVLFSIGHAVMAYRAGER
jgi:thiosulfate reductase cytochrome b subunit